MLPSGLHSKTHTCPRLELRNHAAAVALNGPALRRPDGELLLCLKIELACRSAERTPDKAEDVILTYLDGSLRREQPE